MKAIITRYHGATDHRSSRVSAHAEGVGRVFATWDDALDIRENHSAAARKLCERYQWHGRWVGGGTPDQRGFAFVWVSRALDSDEKTPVVLVEAP